MRRLFSRRFYLVLVIFVMFVLTNSPSESQQQPAASDSASLKTFLQGYVGTPPSPDDETTQYIDAFVDLNGDGRKEAVVYITGRGWCGSGGCPTLVVTPDGSTWRVVTKILLTRPRIRVLAATSHGWRSLTVWVQGGGIQDGYEAELRFDGKTYPANPTVPPARRLIEKMPGEVVIQEYDAAKPLYP